MKYTLLFLFFLTVLPILTSSSFISDFFVDTNGLARLKDNTTATFYVTLRQKNLDKLASHISQISNPYSPNYGRYMSKQEIDNLISPSQFDKNRVRNWLERNGVHSITEYGDAFKCLGYVKNIEHMFSLRMSVYRYKNKAYTLYTNNSYHVPESLSDVIENVYGVTFMHFNPQKRNMRSDVSVDKGLVGREVLQRIYNMTNTLVNGKSVSIGPMEYQGQSGFSQQNLVHVEVENNLPKNPVPKNNIIGNNGIPDGESELDIQLISQVAANAELWYEDSNGWMYEWAVDFYNRNRKPQVISLSWGWNEEDQCSIAPIVCKNNTSQDYVRRTNTEFMKITAQGITIVVASGDAGSPGRTNEGCENNNDSQFMNPVFPGSSEWVLSVGATYLVADNVEYNYTTPVCHNISCANGTIEQGTMFNMTGWTSGSGFARWTKTPQWQKRLVNNYINSTSVLPNRSHWNPNGRAYPDVAAIGHNCLTYDDGMWMGADGTSCSSPIMAGVVTVLNDHQVKNGKPLLGYVNPLFYRMYQDDPLTFNDVVTGFSGATEMGFCGDEFGFYATKGWDPVSGLGSPNVGRMMEWLDANT